MLADSAKYTPLKAVAEFCGEYLVPGGSNLVKGDLKQGGIHAVLGLAARALFGYPALLLVSANSLLKASTGKHIFELMGEGPDSPAQTESPPATQLAQTNEAPVATESAPVSEASPAAEVVAAKDTVVADGTEQVQANRKAAPAKNRKTPNRLPVRTRTT